MNTLEYLLKKYPDKDWNGYNLSQNPNITMELIEKYPNKHWDWSCISSNPNITMEIIEKHPNENWNSWAIYRFSNFIIELIEKYPQKFRINNDIDISNNPNLTIEFIEKHIDELNIYCLSTNKFTYQNKILKRKEGYWLLEKAHAFNPIENLVILDKYM